MNIDPQLKEQLLRCVPDAQAYQTMLYVGAKTQRIQMIDVFSTYVIDVVEVWKPNVDGLLAEQEKRNLFRNIYLGDVRYWRIPILYDLVVWWHGPEHVAEEDLQKSLENLETMATKLVIVAAPHGSYPQGTVGGNTYENHLLTCYPATFNKFGYETDVINPFGPLEQNLLGWKRIPVVGE